MEMVNKIKVVSISLLLILSSCAQAMELPESKVNKVFLGKWMNNTDHGAQVKIYNHDSERFELLTTIAPHKLVNINHELKGQSTPLVSYMIPAEYHNRSPVTAINAAIAGKKLLIAYNNQVLTATFSRPLNANVGIADEILKLSEFPEKMYVYVHGIIERPGKHTDTSFYITTHPAAEFYSVKEQSLRATIQKLKKEGKSLDEAKKAILPDLHPLLIQYW